MRKQSTLSEQMHFFFQTFPTEVDGVHDGTHICEKMTVLFFYCIQTSMIFEKLINYFHLPQGPSCKAGRFGCCMLLPWQMLWGNPWMGRRKAKKCRRGLWGPQDMASRPFPTWATLPRLATAVALNLSDPKLCFYIKRFKQPSLLSWSENHHSYFDLH